MVEHLAFHLKEVAPETLSPNCKKYNLDLID